MKQVRLKVVISNLMALGLVLGGCSNAPDSKRQTGKTSQEGGGSAALDSASQNHDSTDSMPITGSADLASLSSEDQSAVHAVVVSLIGGLTVYANFSDPVSGLRAGGYSISYDDEKNQVSVTELANQAHTFTSPSQLFSNKVSVGASTFEFFADAKGPCLKVVGQANCVASLSK